MFDKHIADFNKNIIELREFIDLIASFLSEKQDEHDKRFNALFMSSLVGKILSIKTEWEPNEREEYENKKKKYDEEVLEIYKKPVNIDVDVEKDENGDPEKMGLKISFKSENKIDDDIKKDLNSFGKSQVHISILYKNSFISLLSSVEWFFSQILHFYYDKFPESAGIQKKTMTLSDLKNFRTIEDAEKYLIDSKIEEVLRGSFETWLGILKTELSLKLGYINQIENELVEIYQRRNLLVHNGGVVNSIYLSKVNENNRKNIKINDTLNIEKAYLDNAICKLQKAFILIAAELWKKLDKDDTLRGDVLSEIVYANLLQSRWEISEGLSYFIINDAQLLPIDKVIAQLNYWLSMKRQNKMDKIQEDIKKADFSDKKEILQLGLFSLREEKELFFEKLPIALDSNQLNIERLEEFPIFEEMRQTDEYKKFKLESHYFKKPNVEIQKLDNIELN